MTDNNQMSADELLRRLKDNIGEDEYAPEPEPKKFKFKRSKKEATAEVEAIETADEPLFESPVPKSDIEGLDVDALMKMYLPQEDYEKLTNKPSADADAQPVAAGEYQAPDSELYNSLSEDGKVCDVPIIEIDEDGDESILISDIGKYLSGNQSENDGETEDFFDGVPIIPLETPEVKEEKLPEITVTDEVTEESEDAVSPDGEPVSEAEQTQENISSAENTVVPETSEEAAATMLVPISDDDGQDEAGAEADGEKTTVIDETDMNIMLAFGMDSELEEAIGKENADKLRENNENSQPEAKAQPVVEEKSITDEYTNQSEADGIKAAYRKIFTKNTLSMIGTIIVAVALFFYENLSALGGALPDIVNPEYYPTVNTMVGLQILFLGFIFVLPYLFTGFRNLTARKPTVDSILPVLLGVTVIYSLLSILFVPGTLYKTMFFPASLTILFVAVSKRLELRREIMAFSIISSKRVKFALESLDMDGAELETNAFREFLPTAPSIFKISKTSFVENFRKRSDEYPSIKLILNILITAAVAAVVLGFGVGFAITGNWSSGVMTGYTAFTFCLPASLILAFSMPSYRGEKKAYNDGSAFVGEGAVDEYTSAASISFEDREVFPTAGVKLRSIKMFQDEGRIDNVIYYTASIYSRLGGPLSDVLNVATADLGKSENTEIISIENNGVEASVDGVHIFLGKIDYLRKNGYVPVVDPDDDAVAGTDTAILYLVCDDVVYAKLYIRYAIDQEFEKMVRVLYSSGICVGIKTIDPNIDDEMLSSRIKLEKYPVRVLKYSSVDERQTESKKVDSGIVSKRSAKALLRTFTLCDKVKHLTKTNLVISSIGMVIGFIITVAVSLLGSVAGIHSVYAALYQLVWLIPSYIFVRLLMF